MPGNILPGFESFSLDTESIDRYASLIDTLIKSRRDARTKIKVTSNYTSIAASYFHKNTHSVSLSETRQSSQSKSMT